MNAQIDLFAHRKTFPVERQRAIRNAADKAGDGWLDDAAFYLGNFARTVAQGCDFLVEDAIQTAPEALRPANAKAWGAAVLRARRTGLLAPARLEDGSRRYGVGRINASPKPMWRSNAR